MCNREAGGRHSQQGRLLSLGLVLVLVLSIPGQRAPKQAAGLLLGLRLGLLLGRGRAKQAAGGRGGRGRLAKIAKETRRLWLRRLTLPPKERARLGWL